MTKRKRSSEILADRDRFFRENVVVKMFPRLFGPCCSEIGGMLHRLREDGRPWVCIFIYPTSMHKYNYCMYFHICVYVICVCLYHTYTHNVCIYVCMYPIKCFFKLNFLFF